MLFAISLSRVSVEATSSLEALICSAAAVISSDEADTSCATEEAFSTFSSMWFLLLPNEAVIRRKYGLAFSYLAQLAIEVFNHIGGIYKGSNLLGILEIGG